MKLSIVHSQLENIIKAGTKGNLESTLAGMMYHALVHGRVDINLLGKLRQKDNHASPKFKAACSKYLPVKWNVKLEKYTVCKKKRTALQEEHGIKWETGTFLEVKQVVTALDLFSRKSVTDKTMCEVNDSFKAVKLTDAKLETYVKLNAPNLEKEIQGLEELLAAAKEELRLKSERLTQALSEAMSGAA